ncbi:MAG: NUDIX domain-containing protein [Cyanobacteria bacterium P01_C01_bin.120]
MAADPIIFQTAWIAVRESPRGFQYLERQGKDSVAVFLLRRAGAAWEVLVRHQHLCIDNREEQGQFRLFPCPVTGGMEPGEAPEAAAMRETYEETGYQIAVTPLGKYIVGTQTNETCYLYYADVTDIEPVTAPLDGTFLESIAHNQWHAFEDLSGFDYGACQLGYYKLKAHLFP